MDSPFAIDWQQLNLYFWRGHIYSLNVKQNEIGPWVILNYLKSHEGGFQADFIDSIINRIEKSEIIDQNEILEIIKITLRIKSEDYLNHQLF